MAIFLRKMHKLVHLSLEHCAFGWSIDVAGPAENSDFAPHRSHSMQPLSGCVRSPALLLHWLVEDTDAETAACRLVLRYCINNASSAKWVKSVINFGARILPWPEVRVVGDVVAISALTDGGWAAHLSLAVKPDNLEPESVSLWSMPSNMTSSLAVLGRFLSDGHCFVGRADGSNFLVKLTRNAPLSVMDDTVIYESSVFELKPDSSIIGKLFKGLWSSNPDGTQSGTRHVVSAESFGKALVATLSLDGFLRIWDLTTMSCVGSEKLCDGDLSLGTHRHIAILHSETSLRALIYVCLGDFHVLELRLDATGSMQLLSKLGSFASVDEQSRHVDISFVNEKLHHITFDDGRQCTDLKVYNVNEANVIDVVEVTPERIPVFSSSNAFLLTHSFPEHVLARARVHYLQRSHALVDRRLSVTELKKVIVRDIERAVSTKSSPENFDVTLQDEWKRFSSICHQLIRQYQQAHTVQFLDGVGVIVTSQQGLGLLKPVTLADGFLSSPGAQNVTLSEDWAFIIDAISGLFDSRSISVYEILEIVRYSYPVGPEALAQELAVKLGCDHVFADIDMDLFDPAELESAVKRAFHYGCQDDDSIAAAVDIQSLFQQAISLELRSKCSILVILLTCSSIMWCSSRDPESAHSFLRVVNMLAGSLCSDSCFSIALESIAIRPSLIDLLRLPTTTVPQFDATRDLSTYLDSSVSQVLSRFPYERQEYPSIIAKKLLDVGLLPESDLVSALAPRSFASEYVRGLVDLKQNNIDGALKSFIGSLSTFELAKSSMDMTRLFESVPTSLSHYCLHLSLLFRDLGAFEEGIRIINIALQQPPEDDESIKRAVQSTAFTMHLSLKQFESAASLLVGIDDQMMYVSYVIVLN